MGTAAKAAMLIHRMTSLSSAMKRAPSAISFSQQILRRAMASAGCVEERQAQDVTHLHPNVLLHVYEGNRYRR